MIKHKVLTVSNPLNIHKYGSKATPDHSNIYSRRNSSLNQRKQNSQQENGIPSKENSISQHQQIGKGSNEPLINRPLNKIKKSNQLLEVSWLEKIVSSFGDYNSTDVFSPFEASHEAIEELFPDKKPSQELKQLKNSIQIVKPRSNSKHSAIRQQLTKSKRKQTSAANSIVVQKRTFQGCNLKVNNQNGVVQNTKNSKHLAQNGRQIKNRKPVHCLQSMNQIENYSTIQVEVQTVNLKQERNVFQRQPKKAYLSLEKLKQTSGLPSGQYGSKKTPRNEIIKHNLVSQIFDTEPQKKYLTLKPQSPKQPLKSIQKINCTSATNQQQSDKRQKSLALRTAASVGKIKKNQIRAERSKRIVTQIETESKGFNQPEKRQESSLTTKGTKKYYYEAARAPTQTRISPAKGVELNNYRTQILKQYKESKASADYHLNNCLPNKFDEAQTAQKNRRSPQFLTPKMPVRQKHSPNTINNNEVHRATRMHLKDRSLNNDLASLNKRQISDLQITSIFNKANALRSQLQRFNTVAPQSIRGNDDNHTRFSLTKGILKLKSQFIGVFNQLDQRKTGVLSKHNCAVSEAPATFRRKFQPLLSYIQKTSKRLTLGQFIKECEEITVQQEEKVQSPMQSLRAEKYLQNHADSNLLTNMTSRDNNRAIPSSRFRQSRQSELILESKPGQKLLAVIQQNLYCEGQQIKEQSNEQRRRNHLFVTDNISLSKMSFSNLDKISNYEQSKSQSIVVNKYNVDEENQLNENKTYQEILQRNSSKIFDNFTSLNQLASHRKLNDRKEGKGLQIQPLRGVENLIGEQVYIEKRLKNAFQKKTNIFKQRDDLNKLDILHNRLDRFISTISCKSKSRSLRESDIASMLMSRFDTSSELK